MPPGQTCSNKIVGASLSRPHFDPPVNGYVQVDQKLCKGPGQMTEISNPHDRFFKDVLSRREAAQDFVLYYLPADVAALLDIESLVVSKDTFVDKGEHIMPTLAEQWTQQGMQQGLQQGKLQSVRESVVENLEARFDVVPRSVVKRIDEIEELSLLKILHKKSVVVDSLGQFKEVMARLME